MEGDIPFNENDVEVDDNPLQIVPDDELKGKRFTRWFLTYPRCSMERIEVFQQIQSILIRKGCKLRLWIIAKEKHFDENNLENSQFPYHIHVVMSTTKNVRWSKDVFDIVGNDGHKYHGNYCRSVFWEKSILYLTKEDKDYFTNINIKDVEKNSKIHQTILSTQEKNKLILTTDLVDLVDTGMIPISQLRSLQKCKDLYQMMKRDKSPFINRKCFWIHGPPGIGKSYTVRQMFPELYPKDCTKWWDHYKGEKVVLFEEFDPNCKDLSTLLKKWSDVYSLIGEVKGGSVDLLYEVFIVTSNYTINQIFSTSTDIDLNIALTRRFVEIAYPEPFHKDDNGKYLIEEQRKISIDIMDRIQLILKNAGIDV